jgi:hypothetical protein
MIHRYVIASIWQETGDSGGEGIQWWWSGGPKAAYFWISLTFDENF